VSQDAVHGCGRFLTLTLPAGCGVSIFLAKLNNTAMVLWMFWGLRTCVATHLQSIEPTRGACIHELLTTITTHNVLQAPPHTG
jgi:hypothetical protein